MKPYSALIMPYGVVVLHATLFLHPLCTVGADYISLPLGTCDEIFIYWNEMFKFNILNILPKPALF
jgi:hypothetical protein